ncbi:MAG: hypothetical protein QW818_02425 [Candidatus Aenigmatarchaeota archaeon]
MSCVRFFDKNYADIKILANDDVSSEQPAFPVSNAYNTLRRSKVWRSDGWYKVTSSNNKIVFRETISVNLTATIAVGEYSRSAFMNAVKAALEAVGDSIYTVTFNSFHKFVISSDGSGGGGIFELRFDHVTSTAEDLLGFDSIAYTGFLSYTADSIRIHSHEWILWDLGVDSNPEAFVLIDARNKPISLSPTAEVRLQGNHTNAWTSPVYEETLSYDDRLLHLFKKDGLASVSLRYWRVVFIDQNPNGFIQVGSFFLGKTYSTIRGSAQFPFEVSNVDRTETLYSEGGQTFSEIKPKTAKFRLDYKYMTIEEKEYLQDFFERVGTGLPFFISFDTEEMFGGKRAEHIRYVKFSSEPTFELVRPKIWNAVFEFEEQL